MLIGHVGANLLGIQSLTLSFIHLLTTFIIGQLLVSTFHTRLIVLFYISLVSIMIANILSLMFPSVTIEVKTICYTARVCTFIFVKYGNNAFLLYKGLRSAFYDILGNKEVLQWTVLYMIVMASNDMVLNYATNLFYVIDPSNNLNGLVMALVRLSGALGAVLPGLSRLEVRQVSELPLSSFPFANTNL